MRTTSNVFALSATALVLLAASVPALAQTPFPITPPAGDLFWIVAGIDDMDLEGVHGFDGDGVPRIASAGGQCGVVAQVNGSDCAP